MNPYITSLRLRTLPLSVSGIILGTGLAGWLNWWVFGLATATTLCLQILSNLCNELGDALKGTDTDQHGRKAYGLQSGTITRREIEIMIWLFIALSVLFGLGLIYCAFGSLFATPSLIFIGLGLLAIIGAITYTLGKHSYGYIGLGDLGVFLFFGLLSTIGAFFLQTQTINGSIVWSGVAIGLPCVGVLNLNNIRDMNNDRAHGKRTLASRLGQKGAKIYHTCLIIACVTIFVLQGHLWTLCVTPVWVWHLWFIWTHEESALDTQMPVLMLSTGLISCLGWV